MRAKGEFPASGNSRCRRSAGRGQPSVPDAAKNDTAVTAGDRCSESSPRQVGQARGVPLPWMNPTNPSSDFPPPPDFLISAAPAVRAEWFLRRVLEPFTDSVSGGLATPRGRKCCGAVTLTRDQTVFNTIQQHFSCQLKVVVNFQGRGGAQVVAVLQSTLTSARYDGVKEALPEEE